MLPLVTHEFISSANPSQKYRPLKILHVTPSFYPAIVYGGPTYSVYALCRSLAKCGQEVRVLTTNANGPDSVLDVNTSGDVRIASELRVRYCHRIADVAVSPTLLRLLRSYISWADVVHLMAVYSFPTIPTLAICKVLGKPVVWSPRGMLQRWDGTRRPYLKTMWEKICRVVAPKRLILHATSDEEALESQKRLPGVETVVIPNGVEMPQTIGHCNGRPERRFVYLGRLHPKKGLENLLDAYKKLKGSVGITPSLVIAGEGDPGYVESVRNRIKELDLSVRMIGHVAGDAKREFFENADVLVAPSHTENFGVVVAEALAHGVPVIASRGTPWSRVEEIGCGLWVDNHPCSLATAIERIASMPLREMGYKGRQWMQAEFAWDFLAEKMIQVYALLI